MTTIENRQTIFATKSTINFDPPYPSKQIPACTISERPMLHRENKSHILKIHNLNVIQDLFWYPTKVSPKSSSLDLTLTSGTLVTNAL